MTRKDVKLIASRLNNPTLLLAIERHEYHGLPWEDVMNQALVELAEQNDYFLEQLVTRRGAVKPAGMAAGGGNGTGPAAPRTVPETASATPAGDLAPQGLRRIAS